MFGSENTFSGRENRLLGLKKPSQSLDRRIAWSQLGNTRILYFRYVFNESNITGTRLSEDNVDVNYHMNVCLLNMHAMSLLLPLKQLDHFEKARHAENSRSIL